MQAGQRQVKEAKERRNLKDKKWRGDEVDWKELTRIHVTFILEDRIACMQVDLLDTYTFIPGSVHRKVEIITTHRSTFGAASC